MVIWVIYDTSVSSASWMILPHVASVINSLVVRWLRERENKERLSIAVLYYPQSHVHR